MALPKLMLDPDASAYSVQLGEQAVSIGVEQGPARRRRARLGAVSVADVQWVLDAPRYQYLTAFRRTILADGTLPFLMDAVIDEAPLAEYQCAFVVGSYRLAGKRGDAYIVAAQIEVRPNPVDREYDRLLVEFYTDHGFEGDQMLNELAQLANVDLPNSFAP